MKYKQRKQYKESKNTMILRFGALRRYDQQSFGSTSQNKEREDQN